MQEENEKRHSATGIATAAPGVGGRQEQSPPPPGGGGYQNKCEIFKFRPTAEKNRDPRLDELREMGLQRTWLDVAEAIGVDAFLQVWRILDADKSNICDDGRRLVPMRSYIWFERYQRNRYIETLLAANLSSEQVSQMIKNQLGESLTRGHILRFRRRG